MTACSPPPTFSFDDSGDLRALKFRGSVPSNRDTGKLSLFPGFGSKLYASPDP